jgi:GTP-binding protein
LPRARPGARSTSTCSRWAQGRADALFADLPGYGYAAVERAAKLRWQEVMADYLQLRRPLHGVVLMIDSRLGFTDLDKRLLALMAPRLANGEVRLLAVLTKADKLNRSQAQLALQAAQEMLAEVASEEHRHRRDAVFRAQERRCGRCGAGLYDWVHPV